MFFIYDVNNRGPVRRLSKSADVTKYYCKHLHNYYKLKLLEIEEKSFEARSQIRLEIEIAERKMAFWYRKEELDLKQVQDFKGIIVGVYEAEKRRLLQE